MDDIQSSRRFRICDWHLTAKRRLVVSNNEHEGVWPFTQQSTHQNYMKRFVISSFNNSKRRVRQRLWHGEDRGLPEKLLYLNSREEADWNQGIHTFIKPILESKYRL